MLKSLGIKIILIIGFLFLTAWATGYFDSPNAVSEFFDRDKPEHTQDDEQDDDQLSDDEDIPVKTNPETIDVFLDNFTQDKTIEEAGAMNESKNAGWWLNSGAFLYVKDGIAATVAGRLPEGSKWQKSYKGYNSQDTDKGFQPQNIFRLVTRSRWENFSQIAYYRIKADNLLNSEFRSESNGLLLFNRYKDGDNLYYAGIRVDGFAVIKKKLKGEYTTLDYQRVYLGDYNRDTNPNLLPKNVWIGLRAEVQTVNNVTEIKLFLDKNQTGVWELVAQAKDDGSETGDQITGSGFAGIRTDFMDVEFDNYRIEAKK